MTFNQSVFLTLAFTDGADDMQSSLLDNSRRFFSRLFLENFVLIPRFVLA